MSDPVTECRELLLDVTPLRTDCGRLCGHACCYSCEGEENGMLLFPGEEKLYEGKPGWTMRETPQGTLILCGSSCDRNDRPLSCRIFPLLPVLRESGVRAVMDARARSVCPLCDQGRDGLCADFVQAVKTCGEKLAQDETQRAFLERLTAIHDELRALQRQFGGK